MKLYKKIKLSSSFTILVLFMSVFFQNCGQGQLVTRDIQTLANSQDQASNVDPGSQLPPDNTDPGSNPPAGVTNFAELSWDASMDSSVVGYKIYYGKSPTNYTSSINVGMTSNASQPNYKIENLEKGVRYYFAIKAYDVTSTESDFSDQVFKDIQN